jgi:hypothetical protein
MVGFFFTCLPERLGSQKGTLQADRPQAERDRRIGRRPNAKGSAKPNPPPWS